jgi:hypothetical protein
VRAELTELAGLASSGETLLIAENMYARGQTVTWRCVNIAVGFVQFCDGCRLQWIAQIVSWLFDSFPNLPTQEINQQLTDRFVADGFVWLILT